MTMANNTDIHITFYIEKNTTSPMYLNVSLINSSSEAPPVQVSAIQQFGHSYQRVHGYLSVMVCVFGIVSNILNIIVLTRRHMHSPTNFILTALAIADTLTMSTYPIFAIYLYIISSPDCNEHHPAGWMYFILFHNLFIVTCHNMAMWLTVALAVFRYIFVCQHTRASVWCSMARARMTVVVVVVATVVSCIPNYFAYTVRDMTKTADGIGSVYSNDNVTDGSSGYDDNSNKSSSGGADGDRLPQYCIMSSDLASNNPTYEQFVRWLFGVVIKILPCIMMAFLSTLLIVAMQQAKKRRARLLNKVSRIVDHDHQSSEHNRTTMMLVGVVICFIVTEIPQGVLAWISAVDEHFWQDVYPYLGDLMDILVLVNSAFNFILYCIMSQQFRNTFKNLFICNMTHGRKVNKANGAEYSIVRTETTNV